MSKLIPITATGTFGPTNGGMHMASVRLIGTAASNATILDGTAIAMMMQSNVNQSDTWWSGDSENCAVFSAVASVSVLTAGATLIIEEY